MSFAKSLTEKIYKYRWHSAITGLAIMVVLSWIVLECRPKNGTFAEAIFSTVISSDCVLVALSAIAFQLDPQRGELRRRIDNQRWLNVFNGMMRFFVCVTTLALIIGCIWLVAEAWLSLCQ